MKTIEIRELPLKRGSVYRYRLYVDGLAKTYYRTLQEADEHIQILMHTRVLEY